MEKTHLPFSVSDGKAYYEKENDEDYNELVITIVYVILLTSQIIQKIRTDNI